MKLLVAIGLVSVAALAGAQVWYVDKDNTSGTEDGTSWLTAYTTLQVAATSAYYNGGEVWVAKGVYNEFRDTTDEPDLFPGENMGDAFLLLREGVEMYGGFKGNETARSQAKPFLRPTVIDGTVADDGNPAPLVVGTAGNFVLDGFSIVGTDWGVRPVASFDETGRVLSRCKLNGFSRTAASVSIADRCVFTGNGGLLESGGALDNTTTVLSCYFEGNQGMSGGAIHKFGPLFVEDCVFVGNEAVDGSAIFQNGVVSFLGEPALISGCIFTGNVSSDRAVIFNTSAAMTISDCVILDNSVNSQVISTFSDAGLTIEGTIASFNDVTDGATVRVTVLGGTPVLNVNQSILWNPTATVEIDADPQATVNISGSIVRN